MTTAATILVVDDETDLLDGVAEFLDDEGFRVLTAANGQQALRVLAHDQVDLLLIDVMMPDLTGPEVVETMQVRHIGQRTATVYMSAHATIDARGALMLRKPFDLDRLLAIVESVLR